jgi:hypothetical protein
VDTKPSGSSSNLAHEESTSGHNVEMKDDVDDDPADVYEDEL